MAARAYWQGQIRLALVSIPVEIYTATKSGAKVAFRQIHEPTGKPVSYEKVVQGIGPVDRDDILRGFEVSKGNYVLLDDDEIEHAKVESRKTLELVQFVDTDEIDPLYYEKPYYVVPADDLAEEAYIVLREALRQAKKVALGQLSVRGTERLVAIKPCGKGLLLETLRYADEVKAGQGFFRAIGTAKPDADLLELATTLIDKKTAPFDAGEFHDRYADALKKLVAKKARAKGKKVLEDVEEPADRGGSNVIDLMAALKKSVQEGGAAKKASRTKATPAKTPTKAPSAKAKSAPAKRKRA